MEGYRLPRLQRSEYGFRLEFSDLALLPGRYEVRVHAMDPEGYRLFDEMNCALLVEGHTRELGVCRLAHRWGDPAEPDTGPDE